MVESAGCTRCRGCTKSARKAGWAAPARARAGVREARSGKDARMALLPSPRGLVLLACSRARRSISRRGARAVLLVLLLRAADDGC